MVTISEKDFLVEINEFGAEVFSIKKDGNEYLHNGDENFWSGRSPIMFPICGRLEGGYYTFDGKRYEMPIHGIAKHNHFEVFKQSKNAVTFILKSNENTLKYYPFDFELLVDFCVKDDCLTTTYTVKNTGEKIMYFTLGAHPGFKVPLEGKGVFEDCYIEFSSPCTPYAMGLSARCFRSGVDNKYSDEPISTIPLNPELFSNDAIFLSNTTGSLCLKSKKTNRYIQMDYQGFKYIGLWQPYNIGAPFVCIEPWLGSPSLDGRIDDFKTKDDMLALDINKEYSISYKITIK